MFNRKKVVIIGGGFGGLALAKSLKDKNVDLTLIDKHNFHNFQPLLYQVATGGLEPDSIAYPIRRIFRKKDNIKFRLAEVYQVNSQKQVLNTSIGDIPYDYLVIATGSTNNFFNFEPIKNKFFSLKSVTDALDIRSFLMQKLEKTIAQLDKQNQENINLVIIGGGPAGIELAGAMAEMKKYVLPKDFPEIDFEKLHIILLEASSKLLAAMSAVSSQKSEDYLNQMGVDVRLNSKVIGYDEDVVEINTGEKFATDLVVWTAGVKGNPIEGLEENIVAGNRIAVNAYNQVLQHNNIFAIGDVAAYVNDENPKGLPMLAQVAIQQGEHLAKNIEQLINNKPMIAFSYHNKGTMATIGRNRAVVDLPKIKFQGRFAWLVWMFVHLISLVGFRNKLVILIDWMQNYFNYDRPLGLIIRKYTKK